jgi:hypothetical protein
MLTSFLYPIIVRRLFEADISLIIKSIPVVLSGFRLSFKAEPIVRGGFEDGRCRRYHVRVANPPDQSPLRQLPSPNTSADYPRQIFHHQPSPITLANCPCPASPVCLKALGVEVTVKVRMEVRVKVRVEVRGKVRMEVRVELRMRVR